MKVKDESINSKLLECAKAEFMEKGFADASMRRRYDWDALQPLCG